MNRPRLDDGEISVWVQRREDGRLFVKGQLCGQDGVEATFAAQFWTAAAAKQFLGTFLCEVEEALRDEVDDPSPYIP